MALAVREKSSCSCTCNGSEWKVKLAQFIPPPRLCANKTNSFPFKPLIKTHFPANGTWISSNTPAILTISTSASATTLHVILHGKILEEHFISRLRFTWPHTQCQARFGTKSRVLFACYSQESLHKGFERSKFALQFETGFHARDFLSVVKDYGAVECSVLENDTLQADELSPPEEEEIPRSMMLWDKSSPSQPLAICEPQIREKINGVPLDEANKQKQNISTALKFGHSKENSEKREMLNQVESICRDLPPRFSSYLEQSLITAHTKTEKGKMELPQSQDANLFAMEDNTECLKAQVAACFMDPSFYDFVSKVEKVWGELNIDL